MKLALSIQRKGILNSHHETCAQYTKVVDIKQSPKKCIFNKVGMLGKEIKTVGLFFVKNWYREYVKKIYANETCTWYNMESNVIQSTQKVYIP